MTAIKWPFLLCISAIFLSNHLLLDTASGRDEETRHLRRARSTSASTRSIFSRLRRSQCTNENPCDVCEGDCNHDSDCKGDLKCFHRNDGDDDDPLSPGCENPGDNSRSNYCYDPYLERPKPHIKFMGEDFCSLYTCSFCEGGCTSDDQCKGLYKCFEREPNQPVPGCSGGNNDDTRTGYCYDPEGTRTTHATWPLNDTNYPELVYKGKGYCDENVCGLCEGNCESDDHCKDRLVCYRSGEGRVVPGCRGDPSESKEAGYCVMPSLGSGSHIMPSLGLYEMYPKLHAKGKDYCSKGNQCGLCEGDCDTDEDCKGRLVCYEREANQEVPGCSGGGSNNSTASFCTEKSYNRH